MVNQCQNLLKRGTGSNLTDMGRAAVHAVHGDVGSDSEAGYLCRWGGPPGRSVAYRGARLQEKSWASPSSSGT